MMRLKTLLTSTVAIGLASLAFSVRTPLAADYAKVNTFAHIYALPDTEQLKVFSLGYRAALADLLFSDTLVRAGMYFKEKVVFRNVGAYLNAITELEPRYRDVYIYGDALLTLSTVVMPTENYRQARDLLEKGLKVFPDDIELWSSTGRFFAFIAVQHLPEEEDTDEWKARGAEILEHACYLGIGLEEGFPPECLSSSRLLEKVGRTQASIANLRRVLAINDDPNVRAQAYAKLKRLLGKEAQLNELNQEKARLELRLFDISFVPETIYELLGPAPQLSRCAGAKLVTKECAASFAQWDSLQAK
jgi:tetratricopeptide (TPR) repeat protein